MQQPSNRTKRAWRPAPALMLGLAALIVLASMVIATTQPESAAKKKPAPTPVASKPAAQVPAAPEPAPAPPTGPRLGDEGRIDGPPVVLEGDPLPVRATAAAPAPAERPLGLGEDGNDPLARKPDRERRAAAEPGERFGAADLTVKPVAEGALVDTPRHRVLFAEAGVSYVPKGPGGAPRADAVWKWEMLAVRRGGKLVAEGARPAPEITPDGLQVLYHHRDDLSERYTSRADGIEQEFVFHQVPEGRGDLVVTGAVETALVADAGTSGGIAFKSTGDAATQVHYGRAIAFDATGRKVDVPAKLAKGRIELTVPGYWLESAAAPVTIDPLIGGNLALATTAQADIFPSGAYNTAQDEYGVAFIHSGTVLRFARVAPDGSVLATVNIDSSATAKARCRIEYSESGIDRYLIVYERSSVVWGAIIEDDGSVFAAGRIYDPTGTSETQFNPVSTYDPSRING